MRKTLLVLAALMAGGLALIAAVYRFVDVNQFRAPIQARLESSLHRAVSLGPMSLKLVPLSIRIENAVIGESPEFPSQTPFLTAKELYVRMGLLALLRRQVEVESLELRGPQVQLIRNRAGKWNAETLEGSGREGRPLSLAQLSIADGKVSVTDEKTANPRTTYDHVDLTLRDFIPGRKFNLDGVVHLPGKGAEQIGLRASGAGIKDFSGTVSLEAVSLAGLHAFLGVPNAEVDHLALSGHTKVESHSGDVSAKGTLTVTDPKLKQPIQIDYEC